MAQVESVKKTMQQAWSARCPPQKRFAQVDRPGSSAGIAVRTSHGNVRSRAKRRSKRNPTKYALSSVAKGTGLSVP